MKLRPIAKQYGFDENTFGEWLTDKGYQVKWNPLTAQSTIDDDLDVPALAEEYKQHLDELPRLREQQQAEREQQMAEDAEQAKVKRQALAGMLITSGFSFDGYTITKYSGYISGDDVIQIPRGVDGFFTQATDVGASLMESLVHIRRNALAELKEAAYALGCNAVIGVDFDYLTLDPETVTSSGRTLYLPYVFGVTANGNAVVIEKNDG